MIQTYSKEYVDGLTAEIERLEALIAGMQEQRETDGRELVRLEARYKKLADALRYNKGDRTIDAADEIERLEGALREIMRLDAGACLHIAEQALNKEQS